MHEPFQHNAFLRYRLWHFVLLLFARHWMIGLTNLSLTALLGLGLVLAAKRWRFLKLRQQTILQLRRGVLLAALFKGALYLVMGETLRAAPGHQWIIGIQFPSPAETVGLLAQTGYSIWHPTELSRWVSLTLGGLATIYLLLRAAQLFFTLRSVAVLKVLFGETGNSRVDILLPRAARRLGLPYNTYLPEVVEIELPQTHRLSRTPMLLGLRRPLLLLPRNLSETLLDEELELVLRHELVHLIRRDHWGRWLLLWVADVASLTLFTSPIKSAIIETEEFLCDRRAVCSSREALLLGRALQKAAETIHKRPEQPIPASANVVQSNKSRAFKARFNLNLTNFISTSAIPLLGSYATSWQTQAVLQKRLEGLLAWSQELSNSNNGQAKAGAAAKRQSKKPTVRGLILGLPRRICQCLIALLLFLVVYVKFHLTLNLR